MSKTYFSPPTSASTFSGPVRVSSTATLVPSIIAVYFMKVADRGGAHPISKRYSSRSVPSYLLILSDLNERLPRRLPRCCGRHSEQAIFSDRRRSDPENSYRNRPSESLHGPIHPKRAGCWI